MEPSNKKVLIYCGHPAQYLFIRETIRRLGNNGYKVVLLIKSKDVLEDLVKSDGYNYINIQSKERSFNKFNIAYSFFKRLLKILFITIKEKPVILIGTDATIAQVGWVFRRNVITVLEDDYVVIKKLAQLCYPFTTSIVCPQVCDVGSWEKKKIGYSGYMKLGYLHPNVFSGAFDKLLYENFPEKFVFIRIAKLAAHHDFNQKGLSLDVLTQLIKLIESKRYTVLISSEIKLSNEFSAYQLNIKVEKIHQFLVKASLLISDSQSMSVEAAMLGIPSLRVSSFVGKISVLEELEYRYQLTFGVHPDNYSELIRKTDLLLSKTDLKRIFDQRRRKMLNDKIDVTAFMVWFIENYPQSAKIMKENPDYQYNFK